MGAGIKENIAYVILDDDNNMFLDTASISFASSIGKLYSIYGWDWTSAKNKGYKCIKVKIVPIEE